MRLKQGANKFRILSHCITGWEYWNKDNKPVRQSEPFDLIPADIKIEPNGQPVDIKHFWAFVVWNYEDKAVQVLQINQATIQRELQTKIDNRNGVATNNDFIITKSGEGLGTKYSIDVTEASEIPQEAQQALHGKTINLEALYHNGDPFSASPAPTTSAENAPTGRDAFAAAASNLPGANRGLAGQNEPVDEDMARAAAQIDGGEALPFV
jgi:hypothetical protein